MSSTTGEQQEVRPARRSDRATRPRERETWTRWERWCDRVRLVLALGGVVLLVTLVGFGERETSWGRLKGEVASGAVRSVQVSNEPAPGEETVRGPGNLVTLRWNAGLVDRVTQVSQRGPLPSEVLRSLQPGLTVTTGSSDPIGSTEVRGWRTSADLLPWALLWGIGWFALLVNGPQPWRATRWAWFWLALPPFGMLAFLLLSGPTPGLPRPRDPARRLTGGWAFLLGLVLGGGGTRV